MRESMTATKIKKARGRPRSEEARLAILKAARALLDEGGLTAVTMEGIAARAGVGKPTIYRSWPNAHAVAMAAMLDTADEPRSAVRRGRTALSELRAQLRRMADVFASRTGRHVTMMLAAAQENTEISKAFRNHFIVARREEGRALLKRAVEEGDLRTDIDYDVALDMIYGPVFFRLLVGHASFDHAFTDRVLEECIQGLHQTVEKRTRS
jgi:AcrR family transcriptional regulator